MIGVFMDLLFHFQDKLGRDLSKKEIEFIMWMATRDEAIGNRKSTC